MNLWIPPIFRAVFVTGAQPWVESVFANLPTGDVYLTGYRRDVRDLGFRLRPSGDIWQVLEPPATAEVAPEHVSADVRIGNQVELLGIDLPEHNGGAGRHDTGRALCAVSKPVDTIVMPSVHLGSLEQRFTTDSRHLTTDWLPGEIIVERYEAYVPYSLSPGTYPLTLGFDALGADRLALRYSDGSDALDLGTVEVRTAPGAARRARAVDGGLTNIGNQAVLASSWARAGTGVRLGIWERPLSVKAGQVLHLSLTWRALERPVTSYTVFVHVIDAQGRVLLGHDYTPLGGAFPSYLWFPKWLEGQSIQDPYRLVLPSDLPAGDYWVEVGMYEMGSIRRVAHLSSDGVMTGDRLILGALRVSQ